MTIRVLIADDHALVRDGLRRILQAGDGLEIVGEAGDGVEAVRLASKTSPDIVLMDIIMPELNGIESTRRIKGLNPGIKIIILSMHITAEYVHRALRAGADGYIHKNATAKELLTAITRVYRGKPYLDAKAAEHARHIGASLSDQDAGFSPVDRLSPRESEILQLVVEGMSSARIAKRIGLSPKTVDTYRSRLMTKLDVESLPELVRFAVEHGLTPPA